MVTKKTYWVVLINPSEHYKETDLVFEARTFAEVYKMAKECIKCPVYKGYEILEIKLA